MAPTRKSTKLPGPSKADRLRLHHAGSRARGGWLIVPLYVAGLFASYLLERRAGLPNEHPTDDVVLQVGFGAFAVVGALLAARRPANAVGWIIAAVAPMVAVFHTGDSYAAYVMVTRGRPDALAVVSAWIGNWYWYVLLVLVVIYLPLFFPDGRLPSRRWLPIAVLPAIATLGIVVFGHWSIPWR